MTLVTDEQFSRISAAARLTWGLEMPERKRGLVESRLGAMLRDHPDISIDTLLERAFGAQDPELLRDLFDALSTNVTNFHREPESFEWLASQRWGPLAASAPPLPERKLRIWCSACSTGPEPYTLAMQLAGFFDTSWDVRILASDYSTQALRQAKSGTYSSEELSSLSASERSQWFSTTGPDRFTVDPALRARVTFRRINLMDEWRIRGPFDAILCRNVMIYFSRDTRERLVNRKASLLGANGVLVVGCSESLSGIGSRLRSVFPAIYVRSDDS
ncbi:MAG: protein-glutamate O-methyltransferase CheR [Phycisphaerales bacterium]